MDKSREGLNFFLVVGIFSILVSCQFGDRSLRLSGDLCYPWLRLSSYYDQPDSVYQFYLERRSRFSEKELIKEDSAGNSYLLMLEKHNLLRSPCIYLRTQKGSVVPVFMPGERYKQFTEFDYQQLRSEEKKVSLKLSVNELSPGIYLCKKIHQVVLVEGETFPPEGRFSIKNYK